MNFFSSHFRGMRVCVFYDCSLGDQVIWIANVVLDGRARSIDGITTPQSANIQAEIALAVARGLEWVCQSGSG